MKTHKQKDRRGRAATRRLMEALDRMITAARQAEQARSELLRQSKQEVRRDE